MYFFAGLGHAYGAINSWDIIFTTTKCNLNYTTSAILCFSFTLSASSQTLQCQLTGGTSCPTMICPNTTVNYICSVDSYAGKTEWTIPSVGDCYVSILRVDQSSPNSSISCLNSYSNDSCGLFTVTNSPFTNSIYCLTSILALVVTSATNGLVVSCSSYSSTSSNSTHIGNASISVVGKLYSL